MFLVTVALYATPAAAQVDLSQDERERLEDARCTYLDNYVEARTRLNLIRARAYLSLAEMDQAVLALNEKGEELFEGYKQRYEVPWRIWQGWSVEPDYIADLRKLDRHLKRRERQAGDWQTNHAQLAFRLQIRQHDIEEDMRAAESVTIVLGNQIAILEDMLDGGVTFDPNNPVTCSAE